MTKKLQEKTDFLLYTTPNGDVRIDVLFRDENVWLTQKLMGQLFDCSSDNIGLHLKNIFTDHELRESAVTEESSATASDGKSYLTKFYSLEAIIAVGYRVNTDRGIQFRTWATDKLKQYMIRGYALDGERFKNGNKFDEAYFDDLLDEIREIRISERKMYQKITDIYATSADYSGETAEAKQFFATVQNKLHFAITGNTAAEIIYTRADSKKPHMGLTTWGKAPAGKILPNDVRIAKNYLALPEIQRMGYIVSAYLEIAELQASSGKLMRMRDWQERLDAFITLTKYEILSGAGSISHEKAVEHAEEEYEKFRIVQDREYISDFDREVKKLIKTKKK